VEARLMLPAVLDERSKALLREFGEINGAQVRPRPRPVEGAAGEQAGAPARTVRGGLEEQGS